MDSERGSSHHIKILMPYRCLAGWWPSIKYLPVVLSEHGSPEKSMQSDLGTQCSYKGLFYKQVLPIMRL